MGDVVTLVEKAQEQFDETEAIKLQQKMAKGEFTFDDFLKQMQSMKNMGGIKDMLKLIPGVGGQMAGMDIDEREIARMEAIVHSMTRDERRHPDLIDASRRRRIAKGSGSEPSDVSSLVKTFNQSRQMMKAMSGMGPMGRMKAMKQLSNMDMFSGKMPSLKMKQRSKRKRGDRRKKNKRKR